LNTMSAEVICGITIIQISNTQSRVIVSYA
jgi:hypothetical protein